MNANIIKKVLGFFLTLLAGVLGFQESSEMFLSFGSVAASVYLITELVKPLNLKVWAQVISWSAGIVLSIIAWWLELGMFAGFEWYFAIATGFGIALIVNGIKDSEWIESLWNLFKPKS